MKAIIKSSAVILCLAATFHSPIILARSNGHHVDKIEVGEIEFNDELVSPVPEASTYNMMLSGLGLVGYVVYRRRGQ